MKTDLTDHNAARADTYRELLRAVPGLDGMYRLIASVIAQHTANGGRLLIAGAGGGREIAALGAFAKGIEITALDPSAANLAEAEQVARGSGAADRITFVRGVPDDLPVRPVFDIATSLLVMHGLPDDGARMCYLTALGNRLVPRGVLIHADLCVDGPEELEHLIPAYLAHARQVGVAEDVIRIEIDAVSRLQASSPVRDLFSRVDFAKPREIFRSLWYRCWISTRRGPADQSPRP